MDGTSKGKRVSLREDEAKIIDEINELARILVESTNEEQEKENREKLINCVYEKATNYYSLISNIGEKNRQADMTYIYVFRIRVRLAIFNDVLVECVGKKDGHWRFDASKGGFVNLLMFLLKRRQYAIRYIEEQQNIRFTKKSEEEEQNIGFTRKGEEEQQNIRSNKKNSKNEGYEVISLEGYMEREDEEGNVNRKERIIAVDPEKEERNVFGRLTDYYYCVDLENGLKEEREDYIEKYYIKFTYEVGRYLKGKLDRENQEEIKKFSRSYGKKLSEKEAIEELKERRNLVLSQIQQIDKYLFLKLLDDFYMELTRGCFEMYYHALKDDKNFDLKCLHIFYDNYFTQKGRKATSLDSMKKWYGNHGDAMFHRIMMDFGVTMLENSKL